MTRGYLILAQDSGDTDYVRMAYALALSIKVTQKTVNSVCLATDNPDSISTEIKNVFDFIVPIPWSDNAQGSDWKIENKWKYLYMTPYDETVILDADMIFTDDISNWWDILSTQDVWITDKPRTFKGDIITSTKYRETFVANSLPNVYTAFMYFKQSHLTSELFRMTNIIFKNWKTFYNNYLDHTRPNYLSGDVAYALAIKLLGIENKCFGIIDSVPSFVHMKSGLQNISEQSISEDWTQHIPSYFTEECSLKVGNFEQTLPFHYHIKHWLTDDIISKLENAVKLK